MRRVNRREERNVLAETIQSPTRKSLEGAALARVVAGRGKFGPKSLWVRYGASLRLEKDIPTDRWRTLFSIRI
jgi:hypothetical protein